MPRLRVVDLSQSRLCCRYPVLTVLTSGPQRFLAFTLVLTGACAAAACERAITVSNQSGMSVTDETVDAIINKLNRTLLANAGAGCSGFTFKRVGRVESTGTGRRVQEESDFRDLVDAASGEASRSVIIVREISFCDVHRGPSPGCAEPGKPVVVLFPGHSPDQASMYWLHEIGHSQQLSWVTEGSAHSARVRSVMKPSPNTASKELTAEECERLRSPSVVFPAIDRSCSASGESAPTGDVTQRTPEALLAQRQDGSGDERRPGNGHLTQLRRYLSDPWYGVPVEVLKALRDGDSDQIREWLFNSDDKTLWPNSMMLIGLKGEEADIRQVIEFNKRIWKDYSFFAEQTKLNVPIAVGALAGRHASKSGLEFLKINSNPAEAQIEGQSSEVTGALRRSFALQSLRGIAIYEGIVAHLHSSTPPMTMSDALLRNEDVNYGLKDKDRFLEQLSAMRTAIQESGIERYLSGWK